MNADRLLKSLFFILILFMVSDLCAVVGSVIPGQPVWGVNKRVGDTIDVVESKIDVIDDEVSIMDQRVSDQLDAVETKLDQLFYDPTYLTQADVVGGTLTISSPGNYAFFEDITANVEIDASCVALDLNNRCLMGGITIASDYDDIELFNGNIIASKPSVSIAAIYVSSASADRIKIHDIIVSCQTAASGFGLVGIWLDGTNGIVYNCSCTGGSTTANAQNGGIGIALFAASSSVFDCYAAGADGGNSNTATAGDGGPGIYIDTDDATIHRCIVKGGDAGDHTGAGTGGIGGRGFLLEGPSNIDIFDCLVLSTGLGGGSTTGTGGDGGNGIEIDLACSNIWVHGCEIRNTGAGGTGGGGNGAGGKAVDDDVPAGAGESKIFSNYAHNIANAIKYDLQNSGVENGFGIPSPPNSVDISKYANVYI